MSNHPIFVNNSSISANVRKKQQTRTLTHTLRKLYFIFLSNWMGNDRGDSFSFDFEPNGIPFGLKSKGKLSPWLYPIQFERKWKYSFLSVHYHMREWYVFKSDYQPKFVQIICGAFSYHMYKYSRTIILSWMRVFLDIG